MFGQPPIRFGPKKKSGLDVKKSGSDTEKSGLDAPEKEGSNTSVAAVRAV